MQFLISPATQDTLQAFGTEGYFESKDGSLFSYQVTFEEDESVVIEDTLGRYVPLDIEELDALIVALLRISQFQRNKVLVGDALIRDLTNGADFPA